MNFLRKEIWLKRAQKEELRALENYSQAFRPFEKLPILFCMNFRSSMNQWYSLEPPISHSSNRSVYSGCLISCTSLYVRCVGSTQLICSVSQIKMNCVQRTILKKLHLRHLTHAWTWFKRQDYGFWAYIIMEWDFLGKLQAISDAGFHGLPTGPLMIHIPPIHKIYSLPPKLDLVTHF